MLTMIDNVIGVPVMSLQTGTRLAHTSDVIVDPRQLTIAALYVEGPLVSVRPSVVYPSDIREISDIGFIVDSDSKLMPLDGLVRLQEIIDFDFVLKGARVVDEDGKKHGKVSNYAIDPESFTIQQLYTTESLFRSFSNVGRIIHRSQIVAIHENVVVIKSTATKVSADTSLASSPSFVNPFRHAEQPEG